MSAEQMVAEGLGVNHNGHVEDNYLTREFERPWRMARGADQCWRMFRARGSVAAAGMCRHLPQCYFSPWQTLNRRCGMLQQRIPRRRSAVLKLARL